MPAYRSRIGDDAPRLCWTSSPTSLMRANPSIRRVLPIAATCAWLATSLAAAAAADVAPTTRPAPTDPAALFDGTAVWTVHLTFSAEQWTAMEPKGGRSMLGLMLFGPGGDRGPQ